MSEMVPLRSDDHDLGTGAALRAVSLRSVLWFAMAGAMVSALWFTLRAAYRVFALGGFGAISRDVLWMSPLGHALLFLVVAVPVAGVTRPLSRAQGTVVAAGLLAALVIHAALLPWTQVGIYASLVLSLGAGVATGRALAAHGEAALARAARRTALGLVALFVAGAAGVAVHDTMRGRSRPVAAGSVADAPNVLLIVFDTFRARDLGTYGSTSGITPAVDRFAAGATVFDWAVSSSGWTLPSHATMFTGRYSQRLGVDFEHRLGPREPTVAEAFLSRGYETAGFVANLHYVSWESGLNRGFQSWSDYPRSWEMVLKSTLHGQTRMADEILRAIDWRGRFTALRRKRLQVLPKPEGPPVDAREITDRFMAWQGARDRARPWFAFINYFDPHKPYLTPRRTPTTGGARDTTMAGYQADVAFLDAHIGRLLDSLERGGSLRNTVVVITADHGEHFGEHGLQGHANSVYTGLVHVPLIVRWDGHVPAGRRVTRVVSHRDLAQTLVDLAGLRDVRFPGHSLAGLWRDSLAPASEAVTQHLRAAASDPTRPASDLGMTSIFDDRWQVIRTMRRAIEEIYDYRADPDAARNLVGSPILLHARDSLLARLRTALVTDNRDVPSRLPSKATGH